MTRPPRTVLEWQAVLIHADTGSYERTAAELVRRGATADEVRELIYPSLGATERRLLDLALRHAIDPTADPLAATPAEKRGIGRPGYWSPERYRQRWREAVARGGLRPDADVEAVAPHFELSDGTIGAEPPYLRRLDRRYGPGQNPE